MSAPLRSLELESAHLESIALEQMPLRHPTRMLSNIFLIQLIGQPRQHLPELSSILEEADDRLLDYCLILSPVAAQSFLDFTIISNGGRLPGAEIANLVEGERYSDRLLPQRVPERLMELASCIVLKSHRLTRTLSARRSTLNMKVYRGVYPVWHEARQNYAVILSVAPCYVEV